MYKLILLIILTVKTVKSLKFLIRDYWLEDEMISSVDVTLWIRHSSQMPTTCVSEARLYGKDKDKEEQENRLFSTLKSSPYCKS